LDGAGFLAATLNSWSSIIAAEPPPRINPSEKMRLTISVCGAVLIGFVGLLSSADGDGASPKSTLQITNNALQSGAEESGWHRLDAGPFSILAPSGWGFRQSQGVDSYVGEFAGDGVVLHFDFGRYSNPLEEEKKPTYVVVHKSIGGRPAKIASPRTPGYGITGVYFRNVGDSHALTLFGHDLTPAQQDLVLKIFDTLRFGGPVRRYVPPPPPKQPFTVKISSVQDVFKSGSEIRLQIAITNITDSDIAISRAIDDTSAEVGGWTIEVWDDTDKAPPETQYQRLLRGEGLPDEPLEWSVIMGSLSPGETFKDAMIVTKFYDLSKPGKYSIQVQRIDPTSKVAVKSDKITVTVTP
jgi:hypothetical protein